ncbi:citrate lyase subunit beta/citryl-CoA lyase [Tahibacter aquaticus]|jgi:citrate lyase subunit beta/citryl-CoA lyase|uniref:Citrate lyase subunit beta/citryl-CoA lyase n=1 Tax=Tahibacter aquaticus TaxID=520092 RepID=A0A4R6YUX0_9GAMM|nr:CoA ester lyase [Tahibacter aquaticus]TDR42447.1 citrate lyase subunit beta/citryl-CoA lyase [Tahibacter aquaticus]
MRSKLFVPGSRPELFAKALAGEADAISFDLEDAVPADGKAAAREAVAAFLRSAAARDSGKLLIVRINAADSVHFADDLAAIANAGADMINLPKAESAQAVRDAVAALEAAEARHGVTATAALLLNIETPRGLREAAAIAAAHHRVAGLQLGLGDLFEPPGIARRDNANVHAAMFGMRMAAAEAGVFACDAAFADLRDSDGYRAEAEMARRLGYCGKTCIHPSQVALANDVFRASPAELAAAQRIVAAADDAARRGAGAFVVDGRMVDAPFLRRAQGIVAAAQRERSTA